MIAPIKTPSQSDGFKRVLLVLAGLVVVFFAANVIAILINPDDHCLLFGGHMHMFGHPKTICTAARDQLTEMTLMPILSLPIVAAIIIAIVVKWSRKSRRDFDDRDSCNE